MDILLTRVPHHYHANHDCVVYECAILNHGVVEGKRVIVPLRRPEFGLRNDKSLREAYIKT